LSFGTMPAKRSPLATTPEIASGTQKSDPFKESMDARWIIGGDNEGKKIWLEAGNERVVPISLGNERPGFLRESSGQESPGVDGLIELELSVYKFNDVLLVFLTYPSTKPPPDSSFKQILKEISSPVSIPPTPQDLKPFILLHDPVTHRIYSTVPPIPAPTIPAQQSFSLTPKRNPVKRDPWPRDHAIEVHTHILRLRQQYDRKSTGRRAREFTAKTSNYFIFRTLVPTDDRAMSDFAEGWYIVKTGQPGQGAGAGLGRGDDAGGLEDIAKAGREKSREVWKAMSVQYPTESDEEQEP